MSEPVPDDAALPPSTPEPGEGKGADRRYPSTIGGAFFLAVLLSTGVGIGIAWSGNWRLGVRWVASALLLAALVRLVLPQRDAGMLAVRHRVMDCLLLGGVAAALFFLATTIPDQPF